MSGRIRSIKPEWIESETIASLSDTARMLSVALIVLADDYGNGRAHPLPLASRVWPYASGDPSEVLARLSRGLRELSESGFVRLYRVAGQQYFNLPNWSKHQRVDKPSRPLVPGPDRADDAPLEGVPPPEIATAEVPKSTHGRETLASLSGVSRETLVSGSGSGSGSGRGIGSGGERDPDLTHARSLARPSRAPREAAGSDSDSEPPPWIKSLSDSEAEQSSDLGPSDLSPIWEEITDQCSTTIDRQLHVVAAKMASAPRREPMPDRFRRVAKAFAEDCERQDKRPVLSWLLAQWSEWDTPPRRARSSYENPEADRQMRADLEREGAERAALRAKANAT